MSVVNSIIGFFASLLVWTIFAIYSMLIVKHCGGTTKQKKKRYKKNPYFTMPFYKKVFFMGFNSKKMKVITVLSFIGNIGALVNWIACIWNVIYNSDLAYLTFQISGTVYFIILGVRTFILYYLVKNVES